MSTKAIHEALDWLENYLDHNPEAQDARRRARAKVEAIERAAKGIVLLCGIQPKSDAMALMERIAEDAP